MELNFERVAGRGRPAVVRDPVQASGINGALPNLVDTQVEADRMEVRGPVLARSPVPINASANFIKVRSPPLYHGHGFGS